MTQTLLFSIKADVMQTMPKSAVVLHSMEAIKSDFVYEFHEEPTKLLYQYFSYNLIALTTQQTPAPNGRKIEFPNLQGLLSYFPADIAAMAVPLMLHHLIEKKDALFLFPTLVKTPRSPAWSSEIDLLVEFKALFKEQIQNDKVSVKKLMLRLATKNNNYFKERYKSPKTIQQLTPAQLQAPRIILEQWRDETTPDFRLLSIENEIILPAIRLLNQRGIRDSGQIQIFKEFQLTQALIPGVEHGNKIASAIKGLFYINSKKEKVELPYYLPTNQKGEFNVKELEYHLAVLADVYQYTYTQLFPGNEPLKLEVLSGKDTSEKILDVAKIKKYIEQSKKTIDSRLSQDPRYEDLKDVQNYAWAIIRAMEKQELAAKKLIYLREQIRKQSKAPVAVVGFYEIIPGNIFQESEIDEESYRADAAEFVFSELKNDKTLCGFEKNNKYYFADPYCLDYMKKAAQLRYEQHMAKDAILKSQIETKLVATIDQLLRDESNLSMSRQLITYDKEVFDRGVVYEVDTKQLKSIRDKKESFSAIHGNLAGGGGFILAGMMQMFFMKLLSIPMGVWPTVILGVFAVAALGVRYGVGKYYSITKTKLRSQTPPKPWKAPKIFWDAAEIIANVKLPSRNLAQDKNQDEVNAWAQEVVIPILFPSEIKSVPNHFLSENTVSRKIEVSLLKILNKAPSSLKKLNPGQQIQSILETLQANIRYLLVDEKYRIEQNKYRFLASPQNYHSEVYPKAFYINPKLTEQQCLGEVARIRMENKISENETPAGKYHYHLEIRVKALFRR